MNEQLVDEPELFSNLSCRIVFKFYRRKVLINRIDFVCQKYTRSLELQLNIRFAYAVYALWIRTEFHIGVLML